MSVFCGHDLRLARFVVCLDPYRAGIIASEIVRRREAAPEAHLRDAGWEGMGESLP
ncbi:MAG: hypothetical protein OXE86_09345 [Alphaproteobacteria bacterium]|nr:hypothetical protein [Alphaproteobacteria bacterium]